MKTTNSEPTVTTQRFTPGAVDETAFAAFVAKTEKGYRRAAAKAKPGGLYYGWTETEIVEAARFYCGCYRHHYRVLVPTGPAH